ncbi:hypothetical protein D3C78_911870 [compost metagenome]
MLLQRVKAGHFQNTQQSLASQYGLHQQMAGAGLTQLCAYTPERFRQVVELARLVIQCALAQQPFTEFELRAQWMLTVYRITTEQLQARRALIQGVQRPLVHPQLGRDAAKERLGQLLRRLCLLQVHLQE